MRTESSEWSCYGQDAKHADSDYVDVRNGGDGAGAGAGEPDGGAASGQDAAR